MNITYHSPGTQASPVSEGDIILTHSKNIFGLLIRFGQRLRFRGDRRPFAQWNHAALVVGDSCIAEALAHGVIEDGLEKYDDIEYVVVHTELDPHDLVQVQAFARSVLHAHSRYGYFEILSLGLSLLPPRWIQFGQPGTFICSGFVAEAMTRAGVIWNDAPAYMMPANIAEFYGAGSPYPTVGMGVS